MERTVALDPVAWGHVAQQLGPRYRSLQQRIQQAIGQGPVGAPGSAFGATAATRQAEAGVLGGEARPEAAMQAGTVALALNAEEFAAVQEAADKLNIPLPQ